MEPGWDTVIVILGYHVRSVRQSGKKATVTVEYEVAGKMAVSEWENVERREIVRFELEYSGQHWSYPDDAEPALVKAKPRWRITDPVLMPHVSVPWAIDRMKEQVVHEKDLKEREKVLKILRRLQAIQEGRAAAR